MFLLSNKHILNGILGGYMWQYFLAVFLIISNYVEDSRTKNFVYIKQFCEISTCTIWITMNLIMRNRCLTNMQVSKIKTLNYFTVNTVEIKLKICNKDCKNVVL